MQRSLSSLLAVGALAAAAIGQTIVVPAGYDVVTGNSNNSFPWNRGASSMRHQQIYDSTNFTSQSINYPVIIQGMRIRPYPGATTVTWAGGSWPSVQIDMASCPNDYLTPSATFASNLGPDLTTVANGPVTVTGGACLGTGVIVPWHIDIPFTNNFLYDPTSGVDLTVDVYLDGTGWSGTNRSADVVSGAAANALGTRVYSTAGLTATTGTIGTNHSVICEFTYVPANGLFAGFSADVTNGLSPQTVNFTDSSYSSDPGGVLGWAWDFDGDSVIDSTLQNPTFVYANCGTYNVSLTVVDAAHPAATETKTGYITIDGLNPDFTASTSGGFAPVNVQFTDTTTGPVLAWLWDLDGDSVIDSNLQNPTWVYPTPGNYTVSLTVINACNNLTVTKTNLVTVLAPGTVPAPPEVLQYQLNEVRGTSVANTASTPAAPAQGTTNNSTWMADPGRPLFKGNEAGFGCM
ncbi:MAG: PKD domain-containing protein, partial [Planctomycetes bacterium]|nr:PKD domain-containing protein [Planctomycetota bacterium]